MDVISSLLVVASMASKQAQREANEMDSLMGGLKGIGKLIDEGEG